MKPDMFAGIDRIEQSLDYHLQRHRVLASNLANAETPGYRARDLEFVDVLDEAQRPAATHEGHLVGEDTGAHHVVVEDEPGSYDNNGVRMERAMSQLSANKIRYEAAVELAQRQLALLEYAARDGGAS